jgi:hypothetical protein
MNTSCITPEQVPTALALSTLVAQGVDELDIVEIVMAIEAAFEVEIPESAFAENVGEISERGLRQAQPTCLGTPSRWQIVRYAGGSKTIY